MIVAVVLRMLLIHLYAQYYRQCVPKTPCGIFLLGVIPAILLIIIGSIISVYSDDWTDDLMAQLFIQQPPRDEQQAVLEVVSIRKTFSLDAFERQK